MSDLNRWSIEELLARYSLEPQLNDVFVEGSFDKEILSAAFAKSERHLTFYEIDVVDVSAAVLEKYGLTNGNKQRVIALANELGFLDVDASVLCLVDRDLDHWFGETKNTERLRWTLFCSIESHFITNDVINDVVVRAGRARIQNPSLFIASLFTVLRTLYALRLADRELSLCLKWVALKKYLNSEGESMRLETEKYAVATLGANSALGSKDAFLKSANAWLGRFDSDVRLTARGHDYTELLAWAIGEFDGHKTLSQQVAVERMLVLLAKSVPGIAQELL